MSSVRLQLRLSFSLSLSLRLFTTRFLRASLSLRSLLEKPIFVFLEGDLKPLPASST